jgi:hypothetical protein
VSRFHCSFRLLAALLVGSVSLPLSAAPQISIRSGQSAVVAPGGFFSATLAVRESTDAAPGQVLRESLILPPGWADLSPAGLAFVPTAAGQIRVVAVSVPRTAAAGDYTLIYSVGPEAEPEIALARTEMTITVPAVTALRIEKETAPERLVAGDRLSATWRLINQSNHPGALALKARSSLGFPVTLTTATARLQPGESLLVTATATTPAQLRGEQMHGLLLEAQLQNGGENARQIVAAQTRLLPRFTTHEQVENDFRVSLRTTALQRKTRGREAFGLQSELAGNGFIDAERTRRIDFLLRAEPFGGPSRVLPRGRYSFTYRSPALDLLLGDTQFSLSPLTQRWLSGRGAGVAYRARSASAGVYYADTPWQIPDTHQLGTFLQVDTSPRVRLRTNLLVRDNDASTSRPATRSVLPSLQLFLKPDPTTSLELEGALSDNRHDSTGDAWRLRLKGRRGDDFHYDLEHLRASPDFFGYYHDVRSTSGNAYWKLNSDWQMHGSLLSSRDNLARKLEKISATQTDTVTTGLDRKISERVSLSADHYFTEVRDRMPSGRPGFSQNSLALAASVSTRPASFRATVEEGARHRRTSPGQTDRYTYFSLLSVFRPRIGGAYSLYAGTGDSRYNAGQREATASATGQWALTESLRTQAIYSRTEYRGLSRQTQTSAEASLGYEFRGGTTLDLALRTTGYNRQQQERTLFLSYRVPLPTPSLTRRESASLAGKVILLSADTDKPLGGVILRLGKLQAATDQNGRFVFPSVRPGRHELIVDTHSLGMNVVLAQSAPIIVELERGKRAEVTVDVAPAARLDGEVIQYQTRLTTSAQLIGEAPPEYQRSSGLSKILIELRRPGERVHRTYSDEHGRFGFDRLPPGDWTLTIDEQTIPERHRAEQKELPLSLTGGTTKQVSLRVLPAVRKMHLLDDTTLLPTAR